MTRAIAVVAVVALLVIVGCGDDGSTSSVRAFCDFRAEGHATGAPPDDEGFERLEELAPDEIRDDVSDAADLFREKGSDAFDDPELQQIEATIDEWAAEHCRER